MNYQEIHFETIDSTNLYLKSHYLELANFTFVSSDYQTNGKGRNDRIWKSNDGDNLLFSLLIKDEELIKKPELLSLTTAYCVCKLIQKKFQLETFIKWPNDVFISDKKVCGILLEGQIPQYVIIGVGLNVNQTQFIGDYNHLPTSLKNEIQNNVDINDLKNELFTQLIETISNLNKDIFSIRDYFRKHNYLAHKNISFIYNNSPLKGKVLDVNEHFELVVESNHKILTLNSGEVSIIKDN